MVSLYNDIITMIVGGQMTTLKGEAINYSGTPLHKDGLVASVSVDHKALVKKLPALDPDQHWVIQTQPFIVSPLWVIQSNGFWAGSNMAVDINYGGPEHTLWNAQVLAARRTGAHHAYSHRHVDPEFAFTLYYNDSSVKYSVVEIKT